MDFNIAFVDLKEKVQQELAEYMGYKTIEECIKDNNFDVIPLFNLENIGKE